MTVPPYELVRRWGGPAAGGAMPLRPMMLVGGGGAGWSRVEDEGVLRAVHRLVGRGVAVLGGEALVEFHVRAHARLVPGERGLVVTGPAEFSGEHVRAGQREARAL